MKKGINKKKSDLFRPPDACKTSTGLHGPPPSGYPSKCFLPLDDALYNGEIWFYERIRPFIDVLYDVGADTTFYINFNGEVHYFEPLSDSNIFDHERNLLNGKNTLGNKKSFFNNYGLSNVNDEKLRIVWETGDVRPNPDGEDVLCGDNIYMKTRRAEDYINEHKHDEVGLVKIDVEGHELEVIQGFGERLKNVCFLQFEHGGATYAAGHKLSEIIKYLSKHGFWGFCYLNMTPPRFDGTQFIHTQKDAGRGGLTPLRWNEDSEDHYAFCNIVCVNKRFLSPGQEWLLSVVDEKNITIKEYLLSWPE